MAFWLPLGRRRRIIIVVIPVVIIIITGVQKLEFTLVLLLFGRGQLIHYYKAPTALGSPVWADTESPIPGRDVPGICRDAADFSSWD